MHKCAPFVFHFILYLFFESGYLFCMLVLFLQELLTALNLCQQEEYKNGFCTINKMNKLIVEVSFTFKN